MRRRIATLAGAAVLAAAALAVPTAEAATAPAGSGFVSRKGTELFLNGRPFRFGGSNTYYLEYASPKMVDADLEAASDAGFQVMRPWAFFDIGTPGGDDSVHKGDQSVYFQYWDGTAPAINDGANGLVKLDYVIHKAGQENIKLVLPFTNNWSDFGGIDQYVRWAAKTYHDDFYTDPQIKQWYKNYVSHLLNRVNTYTGIAYKDDPTIMTWELGNEPRCKGHGIYPTSPNCKTTTITAWADEMTRYIKSIDRKHLASVGDEGFFCDPAGDPNDWTTNCNEGVDSVALAKLPAVDIMSYHLYPEGWGKDPAWGVEWITKHSLAARKAGKPSMLGEYGLRDQAIRTPMYKKWLDTLILTGGNGALYWMLADERDDGSLYPDYDGHTIYCPSPGCILQTNFANFMRGKVFPLPAPVADEDAATVEFGQPATLTPLGNDVAYVGSLKPSTVDLDPATAGRQTTRTVPGGTYTLAADGKLSFAPAEGFAGKATISYTVSDIRGKVSNPAPVTVTVKPDPNALWVVYSFEEGTEGWGPASWTPEAGSVAQSTDYATNGTHGLKVTATADTWFGLNPQPALNFTGRTTLKLDLKAAADAGRSTNVAIQAGPNWTWCEGTWGWVNAGETATVTVDLAALTACSADLGDIRALYIWGAAGSFDIDAVRVE
jgi:mannan endo-1,4-beta-mannosidase